MSLVGRGLVLHTQSRYRLADGVVDRLRRSGDLTPWVHRAITYFTAWAERQRRNTGSLLEARDALLRVQHHATDTRRWGEALRLGRLLENTLVLSARWGAWELVLERCLAAAKAIGDRSVEAWALHQMGTRAVCLGEEGNARRLLNQSAALRDTLGERAAAATGRRNLRYIPAAVVDDADDPPAPAVMAEAPAFDALPFRAHVETAHQSRKTNGAGAWLFMFLACAALGGLAYSGAFGELFVSPPSPSPVPQSQTASAPVDPLPLRDTTEVVTSPTQTPQPLQRANILIFTARPGSIATSRSTNLCYAVSDAAEARIEPGVGEVDPAATLTCRRVAPARTTTYQLSAMGRDGVPVTQHLVIIVR